MKDKVFCILKIKISIIYILLNIVFFQACSSQPVYSTPIKVGSEVVIDTNKLTSQNPQFFSYHYRGKIINFFIIKIDGKVLSFIDACAKCYPQKLGYRFYDGYILCRACNIKYPVSEIETGIGSCFPIRIIGYLKEDKYLIPVLVLEKIADKF